MAEAIVSTKRCCTCKETKPFTQFWKHRAAKDGLQLVCIACSKAAKAKWYASDPEHAKAVHRRLAKRWLATPRGIKHRKETQAAETTKDYQRAYHRAYYHRKLRGTQVAKARDAVGSAIRRGELPRAKTQKCSQCQKQASSYHHHKGYEPEHHLSVIPVCDPCHRKLDSHYGDPSC